MSFLFRKRNISWVGVVAVLIGLSSLSSTPARAGLLFVGTTYVELYSQSGPDAVNATLSALSLGFRQQSNSDFTNFSVASPSGTILNVTNPPQPNGFVSQIFLAPSPSQFSTTFPFGTYAFTASNSNTGASQTVNVNYTENHFPDVVPQLTAGSYSSLQGMNASQALTLNFNSFFGDAIALGLGGPQDVLTFFSILTPTGQSVFAPSPFAPTTTEALIPPNVLQAGQDYIFSLGFSNILHIPGDGGPGYFQQFNRRTNGFFRTAEASAVPTPAAILLLGLGLFGIAGLRRRPKAA